MNIKCEVILEAPQIVKVRGQDQVKMPPAVKARLIAFTQVSKEQPLHAQRPITVEAIVIIESTGELRQIPLNWITVHVSTLTNG